MEFCIILIFWTIVIFCYFWGFWYPLKFCTQYEYLTCLTLVLALSLRLGTPHVSVVSWQVSQELTCLGCSWLGWLGPAPCHLICICLLCPPSRLDQPSSQANLVTFLDEHREVRQKTETCKLLFKPLVASRLSLACAKPSHKVGVNMGGDYRVTRQRMWIQGDH